MISRSLEGPLHTTNYATSAPARSRVAQRLERDGIRQGDRVATLAWNTWRHLESWYGILGIGAVYHTVNPRLFTDQIVWIINHAEDRMIMTDVTFAAAAREKLADRIPSIERFIVFCDRAHMPADVAAQRGALRGMARRGRRRFRLEIARRKYRRRHVLHLRHDREVPKASSIRIAPMCSTPWRRCGRTWSGCPRAMSRCRWCRCFTPMAGRWVFRRRCRALPWCCRARSSTAPRSTNCSSTAKSPAPPRCRRCGSRCWRIWRKPAANCLICAASWSAARPVRAP